jgi:flagellar basal-body rod protein FlgF
MDKLIYVAATGAKSLMQRQDNLASNLANAGTTGYRAATLAFRAVPLEQGAGRDEPGARVFALETIAGSDLSPGAVHRTGRSLDVAVQAEGWIAVQGRDGREAYTRSGALQVDAAGVLQTAGGHAVLSESGPITVPPDSIPAIAPDGTISAQNGAESLAEVQTLGRIKLVNPAPSDVTRSDDGLFRLNRPGAAAVDDRVRLVGGALEGSNVNPVESMVGMISAARQFELHMKLLQTAEANSRSAGQLLQMPG